MLKYIPLCLTVIAWASPVYAFNFPSSWWVKRSIKNVQVGPRPHYLVDQMSDGKLKNKLERCSEKRIRPNDFSIGHRGAPLLFPEHTKESYVAAARMGAGILECDVTFTADGELVCRHAECDLHTTTNILATPLVDKCSVPPDESSETPFANVQCCTSDINFEEFKSLCGKMDAGNPAAKTVDEYLNSTANWRTDLYSTCGTLLSHKEAVKLFNDLGVGHTPELKSGNPERLEQVFGGQEGYAQALINDLREGHVPPHRAWPQSFNLDDVLYWINNEPRYGFQAVFLDGRNPAELASNPPDMNEFWELRYQGVNIIAPPMPVLLSVDTESGSIVPSTYAQRARMAGLDIISWTTERSGRIQNEVLEGNGAYYYQSTLGAIENDGDIMTTIDVLARQVGIIGLFSDWPGTTTYYASCMGL